MEQANAASDVLRTARENLGLTTDQVATSAGLPEAAYFDLEAFPRDLEMAVRVNQVAALMRVLQLETSELFGAAQPESRPVSYDDLATKLRAVAAATEGGVAALENEVGWELSGVLQDPDRIGDLNVDGLKAASSAVGVDWRRVLDYAKIR